jgi:hypothetical protein
MVQHLAAAASEPTFRTTVLPGSLFLSTLAEAGPKSVKLPPRSPNLSSYVERFVHTIMESCLERMILFGAEALRTVIREFVGHYHGERNHY